MKKIHLPRPQNIQIIPSIENFSDLSLKTPPTLYDGSTTQEGARKIIKDENAPLPTPNTVKPEPFSVSQCSVAIQAAQDLQEKFEGVRNKIELRFVIDKNYRLLLGPEGPPNKSIRSHYEMADNNPQFASAYCAGTLVFGIDENDAWKIEQFNHKSGFFRPSFQSLVLLAIALAQIPSLKQQLAPTLAAIELESSGGVKHTYTLTAEDLEKIAAKTEHQVYVENILKSNLLPNYHQLNQVGNVNLNTVEDLLKESIELQPTISKTTPNSSLKKKPPALFNPNPNPKICCALFKQPSDADSSDSSDNYESDSDNPPWLPSFSKQN